MRMRSHEAWGRWMIFLSILVGTLAGIAASPAFQIERVVIVGPDPSIATEIAQKMKLPKRATTVILPLATIDQLAKQCHRVESLVVRRRLPNTLVLHVRPRRPVAAIAGDVNDTLVDRDGIYLLRTSKARDVPRVVGLIEKRPALGNRLSKQQTEMLHELLEGLELASAEHGVTLDVSNPHLIRIHTGDGVVGKLGTGENLTRKIVLFYRLLEGLRDQGESVQYIDVRREEYPVWKSTETDGRHDFDGMKYARLH
ncbi:MAG: cell division protein FtsQ/DivIB [Armatimonadota bacterium]